MIILKKFDDLYYKKDEIDNLLASFYRNLDAGAAASVYGGARVIEGGSSVSVYSGITERLDGGVANSF